MNLSNSKKDKRLLKIGYVAKPHGLAGGLLLSIKKNFSIKPRQKIYLNRVEVLAGPFEIKSIRRHKNLLLAEFKEIKDIDNAEKFRGFSVGVAIKTLPENLYWTDDLIGCELYRSSGEKIGIVEDILKTGANDILVSGEIMIPAVKKIIERIDIKNKKIIVKEIPGLL